MIFLLALTAGVFSVGWWSELPDQVAFIFGTVALCGALGILRFYSSNSQIKATLAVLIGFFLGVAGSPPAIAATTANAYGWRGFCGYWHDCGVSGSQFPAEPVYLCGSVRGNSQGRAAAFIQATVKLVQAP